MTNVLRKKVRGRPETAIFQGFVWRRPRSSRPACGRSVCSPRVSRLAARGRSRRDSGRGAPRSRRAGLSHDGPAAAYNISWKVCLILCRFMFPLRCKGTKNALIISHFGRKSSWKNVFWGLYALSICYKVPIYSFMKVKYVKSCLTSQGWKHTGPLFYRLRFKLLIINV